MLNNVINLPTVTYNYVTEGLNQIYAGCVARRRTCYSALSAVKSVLFGSRASFSRGSSTSLLLALPDEVALQILAKLDTKSLLACLGSCTRMRDLYAGENEQTLLMQKKWGLWSDKYKALLQQDKLDHTQKHTLKGYFRILLHYLFDPTVSAAERKEVALLAEKAFRHLLQSDMKGPLLKILSLHPVSTLPGLFEKLAESDLHLAVHFFLLLDIFSEEEKVNFLTRVLPLDQTTAENFADDFREAATFYRNQPAWMVAVSGSHWQEILPAFLESNPQGVHLLNFRGQNPLAFACKHSKDINVVMFLLKEGASPDVRDAFNRNAVDYARERADKMFVVTLEFGCMLKKGRGAAQTYLIARFSYPPRIYGSGLWDKLDTHWARGYDINIEACQAAYMKAMQPAGRIDD